MDKRILNPILIVVGALIAISFIGIGIHLSFIPFYNEMYRFITQYISSYILCFLGIALLGFGICNYSKMKMWVKIVAAVGLSIAVITLLVLLVIFVPS